MSRIEEFFNRTARVEVVTPVVGNTAGSSVDITPPRVVPVRFTITRPADTTAYAANDAVASSASAPAAISFSAGRTATGTGYIKGLLLQCSNTAATEVISVDFYNAAVTPINDNAEATRLIGDVNKFLGTATLGALAKPTANSTVAEAATYALNIPFQCDAGGLLYAIVRTAAYTPVSAEVFNFTAFVEQLS